LFSLGSVNEKIVELLHFGGFKLFSFIMGIRLTVLIYLFDISLIDFSALQLIDKASKHRLLFVTNFQRFSPLEITAYFLFIVILLSECMFSRRKWSLELAIEFSLPHQFFILFEANDKFGETLGNGGAYCSPFMFVEIHGFHVLAVVKSTYRGLNSEGKGNFDVLEHDCSSRVLFLIVYVEGAAVKPKIRISFLH
jgi:hypothetical protein